MLGYSIASIQEIGVCCIVTYNLGVLFSKKPKASPEERASYEQKLHDYRITRGTDDAREEIYKFFKLENNFLN